METPEQTVTEERVPRGRYADTLDSLLDREGTGIGGAGLPGAQGTFRAAYGAPELDNVLGAQFLSGTLSGETPFVGEVSIDGAHDIDSIAVALGARVVSTFLRIGTAAEDSEESLGLLEGEGSRALVRVFRTSSFNVFVATRTREECVELANRLVALHQPVAVEPGAVRVTFSSLEGGSSQRRTRTITAPAFEEIAANYAGETARALSALLAQTPATLQGRIVLLGGPAGTGKTTAIRALMRAWADHASLYYVLDAGALFTNPAYLHDLVISGGGFGEGGGDAWRVIVIEDANDLLVDGHAGAGLLLNVTDGILGAGTRSVFVITTNLPASRVSPALRRPGRCAAVIDVGPMSGADANAWLAAHEVEARVAGPTALADLYALAAGRPIGEGAARVGQYL